MRRVAVLLLPVFACSAAKVVHADPLFDFALSGDGHTIQFAIPNPPPQYDHPHALEAGFSGAGSLDGVSGSVSGYIVLSAGFTLPTLVIDGLPGPSPGSGYPLYGPPITSLAFVPVSSNPVYSSSPGYDFLVVPSFVPDTYAFRALDGQTVDLTITETSVAGVTPEPSTWVLLGTGAAAGLSRVRRRARG